MPLSKIFQLPVYRGGQFFIGGGNRSTQRKPLICHKSLTNFIFNLEVNVKIIIKKTLNTPPPITHNILL
jgi:hypothetical protein